jgi:hypothetical protein
MKLPTHVHASTFTYRLSRRYHGLKIAYRCWVELRELQQPLMGGNFALRWLAKDAFDLVALADEVDEPGVNSVKHMYGSKFPSVAPPVAVISGSPG